MTITKCPHCEESFTKLNKHITEKHPEVMDEQFVKIKALYEQGLSAKKISESEGVNLSTTSIVRYIGTQYTKEEIERRRCKHIGGTVQTLYDTGKFDFVKEINSTRNRTPEAKQKNAEGVQKAYDDGRKVAWSKGLTKLTDEKVLQMSGKMHTIMKAKAAAGELTTLLQAGDKNPHWIDGCAKEAPNNRPEDFTKSDRNAIKLRANYRCEMCGKSEILIKQEQVALDLPRWYMECDHIVPIHQGGTRDIETNAQALCTRCHYEKTKIDSGVLEGRYDSTYENIDHAVIAKMFDGTIESGGTAKIGDRTIEILDLRKDYAKDYAYKKHLTDKPLFFFSDEWNQKRDICLSMINHRLKRTTNSTYARECEVVEIKGNEAEEFFLTNHISGHVKSSIYLGLKHNGVLVSAASFRKPFSNREEGMFELARFCSLLGHNVVGGFGKILAVAKEKIKALGYTKLLSYADLRFGSGQVYAESGFTFTGHTGISYGYTDGFSQFNRFKYKAQPGKTEKEVVAAAGVFPYYGCGSNRYELVL